MAILLVDDSLDSRLLFNRILVKGGYTVFMASSALEAYQQLGLESRDEAVPSIELVLMDLIMPEINGIEACRHIKDHPDHGDTPVIIITSEEDVRSLEKALDAGAVDYITKPVRQIELLARVRAVLRLKKEIEERKTNEREISKYRDQLEELVWERTAKLEAANELFKDQLKERIRVEEKLRESEEKYRSLFETMAQGVVYTDDKGEIISTNSSAERILGLSLDQLTGRSPFPRGWKMVHEDKSIISPDELPSTIARRTKKEIRDVIMGVFHPTENRYHWLKINAVPKIQTEGDGSLRVYSTFEDITELKQSEQELARAKKRLEKSTEELKATLQLSESQRRSLKAAKEHAEKLAHEAEKANRAKAEFLANISHELRTPLNPIVGMSEALLEFESDPEQTQLLRDIHESAMRLLNMINDLIELTRIEAGDLALHEQPFNLTSLLDTLRMEFAPFAESKHIMLHVRVDSDVPRLVEGDAGLLLKVLKKLLDNAIKFTDEGEVTLLVDKEREEDHLIHLHFMIKDTGVGMPEEHLARLTQDFTQADGSKTRKYGGLGLGLTLARRLTMHLKGQITAKSLEKKGSTFNLVAPFKKIP